LAHSSAGSSSHDPHVARVRTRLTLWYAGTFTVILLLLGVGLFVAVRRQLSRQLDDSLSAATIELARVASSRKLQEEKGDSALLDAVDELRIPERTMYLLDSRGSPLVPTEAEPWIRESAITAVRTGSASAQHDTEDDRTLRLEARRFRTPGGRTLVAVAIADQLELEDRYEQLIGVFAGAALIAVVLVAIGGSVLARKSTAPIEATIDNMRRFMADAAHQLKTPIAILRTNADVALQRQRDAEGYRSALKTVEDESRRLGAIVDHLLVLARADAGDQQIARRPLYLDDIAGDCIGAARALAARKDVLLEVDAFEEAPISGDPALVRDLILILLDNAIKFTPPGGRVTIDLSMKAGHPTMTLTDTGIGIEPEDLPRVFDRFYRGAHDGAEQNSAGLGLSIAKWIADEHGASITIQSVLNRGSTVTLAFPVAMRSQIPSHAKRVL
jgi:signal transduction histidine kinase